ncbi:Tetratricopeptide domain-contaning protein (plasmid) [Candidatus Megaera polyxenophila]|nr:Tetratricopeptide domain-contaning protein [Candidatus Megaera polyxenophila]
MKEHIKLRQEGDELFKIKEYHNAVKKYQEALLYNTQYSTGYVHLAKALLGLNKYDEAIQQCQKALSIKSDYAYAYLVEGDAHKLKAETLLSLKDFKLCSEECQKSEECYKTASKYHEGDYKTGKLRLSALEELENLLNISIASKSTATSTDEEFDFDPEENEETNVIDKSLATQKIVDIKITAEDTLALAICVKNNNVEFITEFAIKNSLTQEQAYSLLLTQIMLEHHLPDKKMTELFELIEPDLTIFNKYNSHSLISVLLKFGTRDDVLFLNKHINEYEWTKIELDKADQMNIHSTLSMGNPLEATQNEYIEFVTGLLGNICTEESIHDSLII